MQTKEEAIKGLAVICYTCKAGIGVFCKRKDRRNKMSHAQRIQQEEKSKPLLNRTIK